jgi:hypothetical protein
MRLSVIMPTISGREESCAKMVAAYRERTPGVEVEIVNPKDYPSWPAGCNAGQLTATGDILHFAADDLEPLEGWWPPALAAVTAGEVPAPQLWDFAKGDGPPVNERADGPPGVTTAFSRVPTLTRAMAEAIGPWPVMDYYADNWVSDKARLLGYETRVMEGYAFVHHWHPVGRLDAGDWVSRSVGRYNEERAKLGLPPVSR